VRSSPAEEGGTCAWRWECGSGKEVEGEDGVVEDLAGEKRVGHTVDSAAIRLACF
jgi:hypothetical protein